MKFMVYARKGGFGFFSVRIIRAMASCPVKIAPIFDDGRKDRREHETKSEVL